MAQKIALWWSNPQCTTLDCTRVQRIQFDHREEWNKTHTRGSTIATACASRHDLKTGPSSKAPANARWSHPTTPATPRTNRDD